MDGPWDPLLLRLSRKVYREYQRQLWDPMTDEEYEIGPQTSSRERKPHEHEAHFHQWGSLGIVFLDLLSARMQDDCVFQPDGTLLDESQWTALNTFLETPGLERLVVVLPSPFTGNTIAAATQTRTRDQKKGRGAVFRGAGLSYGNGATSAPTARNTFGGPGTTHSNGLMTADAYTNVHASQENTLHSDEWALNESDLIRLIERLISWKIRDGVNQKNAGEVTKEGRSVVLASSWGGVATGEESEITVKGVKIKQLVVGPISQRLVGAPPIKTCTIKVGNRDKDVAMTARHLAPKFLPPPCPPSFLLILVPKKINKKYYNLSTLSP